MPEPTKTVKLPRLASEPLLPLTDQGSDFVYYDLPVGLAVDLGTIFSPIRAGLTRYEGNLSALSTDCGTAPPVDVADPVWNSFQPIGFVPGGPYEQFLPFSALTPASGQTIVDIVPDALQSFLTVQAGTSAGKWLRGSVPSGYGGLTFSLRGIQSGGRYANKTFSIAPITATAYACFIYNASTNRLTLYVGGDGVGNPLTQLRITPAAYPDRTGWTMRRMEAGEQTIANQSLPYFFDFSYNNLVTGRYQGAINWLGQELFYSLDLVMGIADAGSLILSPTAPVAPVATAPVADGPAEPITDTPSGGQLATVDYEWVGGGFQVWVAFTGTERIELDLRTTGQPAGYGLMQTGNYGTTYNHYALSYEGATGEVWTFRFRKQGDSADLLVITLPALPAGDVTRNTIYTN